MPNQWPGTARTAKELLTLTSSTLHGNDWTAALADELATSPDEIPNWISGKTPLTMEDVIWPRVFNALLARREKLTHVLDEINSAFKEANKRAGKQADDLEAGKQPVKPLHILR